MAKKIDPRTNDVIPYDMASMLEEFTNGKPVGEAARIPVITDNFSWKRTFVNCWTGWPNDGKSTFFLFMMLMKSLVDNWKWCIWSPEMYNVIKAPNGKMVTSASDLIDEIIFMKTGLNPYKHFERQYGKQQMKKDAYIDALEWVQDHFIFVNPRNKTFDNLIDNFRYCFEEYGPQGFLVDPFKNIKHIDQGGRFDLYLDDIFSQTKEFSLDTNTSFNFIAHPKNDNDPKNPDGSFKICTQFSLSGGSAWNNNMDGIYSIYRPFKHRSTTDPRVVFINLKQRKQQLVGRVGVYDKIEFDWETNRYYFDGRCPIDGTYKEPISVKEGREQQRKKEEAIATGDKKRMKKKEEGKSVAPEAPLINFTNQTIPIETNNEPDEHGTIF